MSVTTVFSDLICPCRAGKLRFLDTGSKVFCLVAEHVSLCFCLLVCIRWRELCVWAHVLVRFRLRRVVVLAVTKFRATDPAFVASLLHRAP